MTLSSSYSAANEKVLSVPKIKCGTASLSGKFMGINELKKQYSSLKDFSIYCSVINPLTGRTERKAIEIKDDESFSLEMSVEVSHTLGLINLREVKYYLIPLVAGEDTKFNITTENRTPGVEWVSGPDDKKGNRVDNMVGYPGNDRMKGLIKKALSE